MSADIHIPSMSGQRIALGSDQRLSRRVSLMWMASASTSSVLALALARARRADAAAPAAAATLAILAIQPFGPVAPADLDFIERALGAFYDFQLRRLPPRDLPAEAFYAPRKRYRAERILDVIGRQVGGRILGVTATDISTDKPPHEDWGILGLGIIAGRTAVISSFRCKRRAPGPTAATIRLGKTAVHEIGHTLGLQHCPHQGCLMEDAAGSVLTSDRDTDLCDDCRSRLTANGFRVKRSAFRWAII